jgi:hypothetical protein
MGVGANRDGNRALNNRRERSAGRQNDRLGAREAIQDAAGVTLGKGRGSAGGAYGKTRKSLNPLQEGGKGAAGNSKLADVGTALRRT